MNHPITGRIIEDGSGALPLVRQLEHHLVAILSERGPEAAAEVSQALEEAEPDWKANMDARRAAIAADAERAAEQTRYDERVKKALALLDETEAAEAAKAQAAPEPASPAEPSPPPAEDPPPAAEPPAANPPAAVVE